MNLLNPTLIPLALALPGLPAVAATDANGLFISHLENILGTSFDLKVVAPSYTIARQAETAALAEISRLNAVLSSYQPDSEFSNWAATLGEAVPVSPICWPFWLGSTNGGHKRGVPSTQPPKPSTSFGSGRPGRERCLRRTKRPRLFRPCSNNTGSSI